MTSRYLLATLAGIGLLLGVLAVIISSRTPPTPAIPYPPPVSPYEHYIATVGMVEASSEDIYIGTPYTEIVETVYVTAGDFVFQGDPLFSLNTDVMVAELREAQEAYSVAAATYEKQLDLPRPEDIPPYESRVKQAEAHYLDWKDRYNLAKKLENPKALSRDEFNQRKYGAMKAQYELQEAEQELDLLLAGAWVRDLNIYRAQKMQAAAAVRIAEQRIARSTIRAPMSGVVMRVNTRVGELAPAADLDIPLMIFGVINPLNIRVDVDEEEVWRVLQGTPGVAYVRGNSSIEVPLTYQRLEPYLVPKRALSNTSVELVDTRVLQLIYQFERHDLPIYPGELMDVYIEAKPMRGAK